MTSADATDQIRRYRRQATLERIRILDQMGMIKGLGAKVVAAWDEWFAANQIDVDENVIRDAIEMAFNGERWWPYPADGSGPDAR